MLLVDELVEYSEDCGTVRGRIGADNVFLRPEGGVDPLVCIELLAQAVAAHEGFRRRRGGMGAGGGFLVGVRDFELTGALSLGDEFAVTARRGLGLGSLQLADGFVTVGGRTVATGELKLFIGETALPAGAPASGNGDTDLLPQPRHRIFPVAEFLAPTAALRPGSSYLVAGTFPAFHGHFPGYPVLPAVAAAALALEAVGALEGTNRPLRRVRTAKFSKPVFPGTTLDAVSEAAGPARPPARTVRLEASGVPVATMTFEFD